MADRKLRIAWFSPLFQGEWGPSLSQYSTELLLPYLRDQFDIELFHNGFESFQDYPTYHFLNAFLRDKEQPFDLFFYQMEDGVACKFVRMHLGLVPGVTWFHHFFLSDDGPEPILNSPWTETVRKFQGERASWPERGAEYTRKGPHALREAGMSFVNLFSLERDHGECERLADARLLKDSESRRSFFLPLPVADSLFEEELVVRSMPMPLKVGFYGSPQIEHRAHKVLQAVRELGGSLKLTWVVEREHQALAEERAKEFGVEVEIIADASAESWKSVSASVDCAIHTLFSVFGQPGFALPMSLARGLPTLVTGFGNTERLVDNVAFRIEPGESEATQIAAALRTIQGDYARNPVAREYAQEFHSAGAIALQLAETFEQVCRGERAFLPQAMQQWRALERDASQSLLAEAASYRPEQLFDISLVDSVFDELGWNEEGSA